jgi:hypothetical protein
MRLGRSRAPPLEEGPGRGARPPAAACDAWPRGLEADFEDLTVGMSRTAPGWGGAPPIGEAARLTGDAISAARRSI